MPAFAGSAAEPPLADSYHALLHLRGCACTTVPAPSEVPLYVSECELPMIDVGCLTTGTGGAEKRAACAAAIARAAEEWGFFQVRNHGVRQELLEEMRREQARLFRLPFEAKATAGLLDDSYRWGTPTATTPQQLSWSEAFHFPLAGISGNSCNFGELTTLRDVTREVAGAMSKLASTLSRVLAETLLGHPAGERFPEGCDETTCFLRLNRYPPCPFSPDAFGLVPHTDSDFLTVLCQDQVGGLQLLKGDRWVAVKPIPGALIVNIGDLFQAWSNNRYRSVEHKVTTNATTERYSVAYFLCPSYDSPIGTCKEPSPYMPFTFGEYRRKVQEDAKRTGKKIGLPNFLV
ncbi:gibberellin 2-beta-dioxygenase 6-like isoform X1 [Phragmites australis]|uniref:gibberellin 2-beta-dioxygenase 6-like isoform X1 n=1 Tax=Phragmites australis TaxID=29695 RepID=UPI002D796FA8|nr:gibberellin 2-beta-dioxygenase 6-like isoform X1 [Phragmites australis]